LGGGLEYAFWQKWTLNAEYLYVSLDSKSVTETAVAVLPGTPPASFNANLNRTSFNVARVGLNYRF
jgi:outer membrane immunogenic protein